MPENTCSEQKLIGVFKQDFVPIDNIPEDTARRDAICMEARASLLIEANCTGERFPAFMKCGRYTPDGWVYPFPRTVTITSPVKDMGQVYELEWHFKEFIIRGNRILIDSFGKAVDRWQLFLDENMFANPDNVQKERFYQNHLTKKSREKGYPFDILEQSFQAMLPEFQKQCRSRFNLCSQISPYNTPEQVCRFFGNKSEVFSELKVSGMWPDRFRKDDVVQAEVCELLGLPSESFVKAFSFRDRYGDVRMQVIKAYDPETQSKILIPVTTWMRSNFPYNQLFCVPLPEDKQPLYNLDLLLKEKTRAVILTDCMEFADSDRDEASDGFMFTSFFCSPGRYDQVDWSPLQDKEVIVYLICNHSGISLEAAYLKARELADFLQDQYDIKLKFGQVKLDYSSCHFKSVEALQEAYRKQPVDINQTGMMSFENDADFDVQYRKAVEFIHSKPREWWEQEGNSCPEEKRVAQKETNKRSRPAYLLRPFLLRGEASMLYASKSTGKSALALSMAAAVVSGKPLFVEKWWTVPEPQNYPLNKVLYLDFENGKEEIEQRKIDFAYPYWPQDKTERERCKDNLIIEDMTSRSGKDYSLPENWQDIINLIDAAKHKGIEGQPVDLLVIDTMTKFSRKPYTATLNVSDFINKLRGLNLAILLVHHEGSNGEVRGWKCGLDDVYFNLRLYRERDKNEKDVSPVGKCTVKDLDEPLILAYHNARTSIEKIPAFEIRFDKKWVEYYREDDPNSEKTSEERRREELKQIVAHYSKKNLEHQDIYPILGIGKETYCKLRR